MLAGFYTTQARKYVAAFLHTSAPTELLVCKMKSKIMAQDTSKKKNASGWKLHKQEQLQSFDTAPVHPFLRAPNSGPRTANCLFADLLSTFVY